MARRHYNEPCLHSASRRPFLNQKSDSGRKAFSDGSFVKDHPLPLHPNGPFALSRFAWGHGRGRVHRTLRCIAAVLHAPPTTKSALEGRLFHEKKAAPQVHVFRLPMHTPSNDGLRFANDGAGERLSPQSITARSEMLGRDSFDNCSMV